jgi:hypothetical protein
VHRTYAIALCLSLLPGCSLLRPPKAEPVQVPVRQPVECNDRALSACDGVPVREYTTAEGLALGLGEALRALLDCQDKHDELRKCVADHNAKVK